MRPCGGCSKPVGDAHKCPGCTAWMHICCGRQVGEEGYGQPVWCVQCDGNAPAESQESDLSNSSSPPMTTPTKKKQTNNNKKVVPPNKPEKPGQTKRKKTDPHAEVPDLKKARKTPHTSHISIKERLQLLEEYDQLGGDTKYGLKSQLARKFNLSSQYVGELIKDRVKLKERWLSMQELSHSGVERIRAVTGKFHHLEVKLKDWITLQQQRKILHLSRSIICARASSFAEQLNCPSFSASHKWFRGFISRAGLKHLGEAGDVDVEAAEGQLNMLEDEPETRDKICMEEIAAMEACEDAGTRDEDANSELEDEQKEYPQDTNFSRNKLQDIAEALDHANALKSWCLKNTEYHRTYVSEMGLNSMKIVRQLDEMYRAEVASNSHKGQRTLFDCNFTSEG